ncbi:MAG: SufE family protein [Melioribacteraceae bacterium]|nr:SufE family protein [Melioribacteraceae bacterium]MCF8264907.1 SufE family protein [Melioribacteraceae bacterium]MCF8413600.1 SufE family protein [Melioribacteraceae bacterium]MCF8430733.1 SufE family protein [Melioribacteraceae bacterium]
MTIQQNQDEIIEEFESCLDWEDKYALVIKYGRELEPLPEQHRIEKNKLSGCQSQVWINAEFVDGKVKLQADSDATIVKGLISLLVKVYSNQTPEDILSTPPHFIKKIGIDNHLSPTRKNGLGSMLKQIQMYAVAFKAMGTK